METEESSTMRNFIVWTVHLIKFRRLKWAGPRARKEEGRSALTILTGKFTNGGLLEGLGRSSENNIRMDIKNECQYEELDWFASDRDY